MPIDPSISLNAKNPSLDSSLAPLSSIMQLGLQSQALKKAKATYGPDVAQRQAESAVAVANQQPLIAQQQAQTEQAQTQAQQAKVDLNDKQTQIGLRTLSGLIQDPDFQAGNTQGMLPKIDQAEQIAISSGASPDHVKQIFDNVRQVATSQPGQAKQVLTNYLTSAINASGQAGVMQPTYVNTGGNVQQVNPLNTQSPNLAPTVGPGSQDTLETDPTTGGSVIVRRDAQGNIIGSRPVGAPANNPAPAGNPAPAAGGPHAPQIPAIAPKSSMNFPAGETRETQQALQADRQATNEMARGIPTQMDNISQSLHVLDQPGSLAKTGTGAAALAKIAGTVGVPVSGDYAANYNTIAHALAIQSGVAAKTMGAGTDAARAVQEVATGSVGQDPVSLRMALTTNRALLGGAADFNNGMEQAIQTKGIFGARQFKNDWSNNFNVELYRLHTAADAGDAKTVEEVKKRLGPEKLKALSQNWQNLQSLIKTGALPNGQ